MPTEQNPTDAQAAFDRQVDAASETLAQAWADLVRSGHSPPVAAAAAIALVLDVLDGLHQLKPDIARQLTATLLEQLRRRHEGRRQ